MSVTGVKRKVLAKVYTKTYCTSGGYMGRWFDIGELEIDATTTLTNNAVRDLVRDGHLVVGPFGLHSITSAGVYELMMG